MMVRFTVPLNASLKQSCAALVNYHRSARSKQQMLSPRKYSVLTLPLHNSGERKGKQRVNAGHVREFNLNLEQYIHLTQLS